MVLLPEDLDRLQGTAQPGGLASPLLPNDLDEAVKNIRATSDIKSPQAIQAIKASRDTGLSTNVTLADPQSVQLRQMERGMRAALTDAPKTTSLMSGDPMRAAAVKEDYESLSLLERLLQGGNPMIDNEFDFAEDTGLGGSLGSAAKQLSRTVPSFAKSTNEILAMGAGALDSVERGLGDTLGTGSTGVFGNARDWLLAQSEWINKNIMQDPSLMLPKDKQGQLLKSEGGWNYSWDRPELLLDPEWLTFNTGEVASSMAPMLAATFATGGSTMVGALVGSGQEAGDLYRELIMDGNDPDKALTAATLFGVGVGWLNKVGLDKMLDKTVATTLFKRAAKSLTAGTVEGVTEYLEEPLQALMKGWAEQKSFPEIAADVQASLANIDVIPGSILFGGGVSYSTHYRAEYQRARFSESEQKFLDEIDQAAATPQMAQHDPLLYQETLRVLKDGGKVTHVYIPAQALGSLYSGEGLSKIADSLGVREQYGDMAEVGGDLKVEIGDYIKTVAADPNFAPTVVNDRRLSEDGFTRNELKTMQKEQAQEFQAVLDVVKNEREAESAIEAEGQQIYKQVVEMRRASGMVSASVTADAAQMAAFYTTMAKRSDGQFTPMQLFDRFGPSEVRGAPAGPTGDLRQDSPALAGVDMDDAAQVAEAQKLWAEMGTESPYFKKWFGDSKVVGPDGKPLVVRHFTNAKKIEIFESGKTQDSLFWFTVLDKDAVERGEVGAAGSENVVEVYLSVKKLAGWEEYDRLTIDQIIAEGYDGIKLDDDYVVFSPAQIKSATGNRGTFDASDPRILMQSAFHGSPYRGITKMSLDYVGTGEGNQAYGYGLYFASKREVAEHYRQTLEQGGRRVLLDGEPIDAQRFPSAGWEGEDEASALTVLAAEDILRRFGSVERALTEKAEVRRAMRQSSSVSKKTVDTGIKWIEANQERLKVEEPGQLYEVTIPDDDTMLDWDKPLSEQPEQVKKNLAEKVLPRIPKELRDKSWSSDDPTGFEIMMGLKKLNPETYWGPDYGRETSMILKEAGIPGLRYLDYTSRGAGEGSHNYVIFDDAQISIDKTYYQTPLAPQGAQSKKLDMSKKARLARAEEGGWDVDPAHRIFHTSKSRFNNFSMKKIGSGAGAQSEGWGIYFAGNKRNAERFGPEKYEIIPPGYLWDRLLDLRKPLSGQSEYLRNALAEFKALHPDGDPTGDDIYRAVEKQSVRYHQTPTGFKEISSPRQTAALMDAYGVLGLRFWAGKDIAAKEIGQQEENYLIWSQNALDDLRSIDAAFDLDRMDDKDIYAQNVPLASDINQAAVSFNTRNGKPLIDLFAKANASSFLHESGHIYFEAIKKMAAAPDAPPQIKEIWATAKAGLYKLADSAATRAGQRSDLAAITGDDVRALLDADLKGTSRQNRAAYIGLQEEWARQIEAYFMEGRTPNLELRSVFQKFKDWLRAIYENFSALGMAEPSAELKPVFDRIFATDQQIAEAEGFYLATKPFLDQGFEMAEEDRKAYLARVNKAKETANDARMRKLAKAYIQALGGKDEFTKAATEEINASPIYRAMDEILAEGGYSREAVEAIVGKEAATALSKRRRGFVTKDGAEPVLRPGFDSLPAMLNALMAAPTKKDAIKNLTETKIAQERKFLEQMIHDDNVLPGDEDYHNDDRLALLHAEFILLSKQVKGRELAARMKDAQLEVAAVREAARQAITKMTTSTATSPSKFARQERKAAKEAFLAKAKGDMAAMAEAKRKEMLNHALFMEAAIAREQMEKLERGARRLVNSKSMKRESRALAERLAIQFGLHRPTKQRTASAEWADYRARLAVEEKEIPTVTAWSEAMYELGYDVAFDPFILTTQEPLDYKTLTWGQVLAVREALNIIRTIDKNERTVFLNGQRIALEEMRAQLAAGLDPVLTKEKPAPKPGSPYIDKPGIKGLVKGIHANHLKLEAILQRLDGWKTGGIWWNTFFRPVAGAEDARSLRLKQVAADLKEMFSLYAKKKGDLFNKQILLPVLGRSFTKSQLLAVALNTGNEGNLLRLAKGEGWTTLDQNGRDAADMQKIMAVLQPLEKQDWDFVQKVWDYLDTFRPEAFALEERLTGKMPERVEAKPVETPFGQYAGGYYPAVYDADRSYTTFSRKQAEDDKSLFGRNHGSSQTKHNHLKARAQNGGDQKVSLDLGVLSEHLFTVVHDITHREPLLEVAKLVRDKEISKMIEDTLGKEVYREFMPWLQDIARERMVPPFTRLERLAAWARKGTTMMSLGLKMTTIITQPFGLTQTFEALGPAYTMRGISTVYRNLPDMYRTITEKSVFMANRLENFDREVRDSMKGVTGFQDKKKAVEKFAYYGIGMAQMGVDLPTWWGGYQKGLAEFNGDEAKAVAYADSVVRLSQSSGATKDLSRVQRGPELQRMFTMFYSYFNMLYNLAYRAGTRYRGDHNIPRAAASALLLWFLPAILTELATGRGPDDDEGEEWMSWAGTKLALYPLNMIVGLRDLTNAIGSGFDYQTTPAAGAPASIVKWAKAVNAALEEEEPERLIKPTVEMIGFAAHLPLKQVEITVGNVWDYVTGEDPDLQVRDLFFNKPKSRR